MTRSLLNNLSSAIMALILATMVWVGATIQANPFVEDYLSEETPVEVINRGEGFVIVGGMDQSVRVKVRSPQSVWEDLRPDSFRAYVDLAGLDTGLHEVPVRVEPAGTRVRIVETSPAVLTVRLDRRAERIVEVKVSAPGYLSEGYRRGALRVTPDEVRISGPQTLVEQVAQVTAQVYLGGEKKTFDRRVVVTPRNEIGDTVPEVEADPPSVMVTVPIEQRVGYRELSIKIVTEGVPASGYWISSMSAEPRTVLVFGDPQAVDEIAGYLDTNPVDVAGATESISQQVPIVFPEGVSSSVSTVQAVIEVSPVLGGQTLQLTPVLQGLGRGLEATFSPSAVEVILSGPLSELEALGAEDVRVLVDLSDYGPGTHFVPLTVEKPESLQVQNILPDQVEVVIAES
jgi:YbbR domain-containing protein